MSKKPTRPVAKTAVELARSTGSSTLLAARLQTGAGTHGKRGKGRMRLDDRSRADVKQTLRRSDDA